MVGPAPSPPEPSSSPAVLRAISPWEGIAAAALAALFALLALAAAAGSSPTYDEPPHLAAGYTYWRFGDFRLNPEHPPLVKLLAAAPLLADDPWPPEETGSASRRELERLWDLSLRLADAQWAFAHELFYGVDDRGLERLGAERSVDVDPRTPPARGEFLHDADAIWRRARLPMVGLGLLLLAAVFAWARELWGRGGAFVALALAAFDPNLLAHAPLVATDVALALFAFAAVYFLWRARRRLTLATAAGFVAAVVGAFAAKHSAVLFVPVLVALALVPRWGSSGEAGEAPRGGGGAGPLRLLALVVLAGLAAWAGLWAVYGFRYAAAPGGKLLDLDRALRRTAAFGELIDAWPAGPPESEVERVGPTVALGPVGGAIAAAARYRLLPEAYLVGVAEARLKGVARWSFLRGEISLTGFRAFFPWAFLLKTPLLTLVLVAAALALAAGRLRRRGAAAGTDERPDLLFLIGPVVFYFAVSVASHLNIGHRHLLAVYPFLWVLAGGVAPAAARFGERLRPVRDWRPAWNERLAAPAAAGGLVLAVALGSSVVFYPPWRPEAVFPHYLAYFNEIAGGPRYGYRSLVDSSLDWGQDLPRLAAWLDRHGVEEPIGLCYFGTADPRFYGIAHVKLPGGYAFEPPFGGGQGFEPLVRPGYLAISATDYQGVYMGPELRDAWRRLLAGGERVDTVGRSIFVYRMP